MFVRFGAKNRFVGAVASRAPWLAKA